MILPKVHLRKLVTTFPSSRHEDFNRTIQNLDRRGHKRCSVLTNLPNRQERRAVCTKDRDGINTECLSILTRHSQFKKYNNKILFQSRQKLIDSLTLSHSTNKLHTSLQRACSPVHLRASLTCYRYLLTSSYRQQYTVEISKAIRSQQ